TLGGINHPNVKCVICHDPHTTENKNFLRQSVTDLCSECHDQGDEMFGAHAFEDREDIKNPRGQSVEEVGSCLICHTPHFAVAKPLWGASSEPPATEREKCTVCHSDGGMSASHAIKEFNHTLECKACHNPHGDSEENPALLIVDPPVQNLCLRCHDEHETIEGGPHDVKLNAKAWPKTSLEKGDRCLACHRPHADTKAGLFDNGLAPGVSGPDAACLACHREAAWDATSDHAARHPRTATDLDPDDEYLPLVPLGDEEGEYRIGCRTCHNPHNGAGPPGFLVRAEEGDPTAALCTECHDGKGHIGMTGHSPASLSSAGLETESCKPCHGVHADPALSADELLWMPKVAADARLPADGRCLGCHRANGPAKPPAIVSHPDVPMLNTTPPDSDAFLPLFADTGQIDPHGTIACATCHLPHGRDGGGDQADALPIAVQRAMRLELRPFRPPNVCSTCHGLDAKRRFLYFHDPKRRTGPLR
ncbi:MAG: hypothetical protein IID33_15730, partial [Planctomycetes bacterium]|nr:hypothetical protein [Planctomycetota bacterium]